MTQASSTLPEPTDEGRAPSDVAAPSGLQPPTDAEESRVLQGPTAPQTTADPQTPIDPQRPADRRPPTESTASATEHGSAAPSRLTSHSRLTSLASTFDALRIRNYRVYFTGALFSNIGTWMQRVAQDWLVLELSHGSGVAVGVTTALQFLPMLLITPYGGVIADRFDKRKILRMTQTWMAGSAAILGLLTVFGLAHTWHVYVLAFVFGVGAAFDNPARQAFVSEVVDHDHMPNAIGLNSASFNIARLIGPAVAGLVIAAFGSGWAILANAVSYLSFIIALAVIDPKLLQRIERTRRAKRQIREGLAYIRGRSDILLVLGIAFFVGTFGLNFQMTSALMAQQVFHKGAGQYGILGTFLAIGSLTGALIGARRKTAPSQKFIIAASVAFSVIEIGTGMMPGYWSFAGVLPAMGLASMLTLNAANTSVQMGISPQLRGRVMAIYMMVMQGGTPIGAPIVGWVGQVFGARWTLIGGGGITLLGVLATVAVMARRRGISVPEGLSLLSPKLSTHSKQR